MFNPVFQYGTPSGCAFTPETLCDAFPYETESGILEFLCDISSSLVGLVFPDYDDNPHLVRVKQIVEEVWSEKKYECLYSPLSEWNVEQPCQTCTILRKSQVVVLFYRDQDQRGLAFLDIAASSTNTLQYIRVAEPNAGVPKKVMVVIHEGDLNLPARVQQSFRCIDIQGANGKPDLQKLRTEMMAVAEDIDNYLFEKEFLNLFPDSEQPASKHEELQEEEELGENEFFIKIRKVDLSNDGDELNQRIQKRLADLGYEQHLDQLCEQSEYRDFSNVERRLLKENYKGALSELLPVFNTKNIWKDWYLSILEDVFKKISSSDLLELAFDRLSNKKFVFSWDSPTDGMIQFTSINYVQGVSREIPFRVFPKTDLQSLNEWHGELKDSKSAHALGIVLSGKERESWTKAIVRFAYAEPKVAIAILPYRDLLNELREGRSPFQLLKKQFLRAKRPIEDLFARDAFRVVCKENEFFGRTKLLNQSLNYLENHQNFYISAFERSGKTSFLLSLQKIALQKGLMLVHLDLSLVDHHNLHDFYLFAAQILKQSLLAKLPETWRQKIIQEPLFLLNGDSLISEVNQYFESGITKLLASLNEDLFHDFKGIVFALESLCHRHPEPGDPLMTQACWQFTAHLGDLCREFENLSLVIADWGPHLIRVFQEKKSGLTSLFHEITMGALSRADCKKMVLHLGNKMHLEFGDAAVDMVHELTHGSPSLVKYLCSSTFQGRNMQPGVLTPGDVEKGWQLLPQSYPQYRHHLDLLVEFGSRFGSESAVLKQVADAGTNGCLPKQILINLPSNELSFLLDQLSKHGWLKKRGDRFLIGGGILNSAIQSVEVES